MDFLKGKKTYIGLVVALLAGIANHFGYSVSEADQSLFTDSVFKVVEICGLLFAAYGRVRANKAD